MQQNLLLLLDVIEERPLVRGRSGLYCIEKKYGKEEYRALSLEITDPESENVLLYRFLSDEEVQFIREHSSERKYYVLAHRFLDLGHIHETGIPYTQLWAICDYMNSPLLKSSEYVRESLNTKNLLRLQLEKPQKKAETDSTPSSPVPVLFLYLLKALLSPVQEAKRLLEYLKHSNVRILNHFAELIDFTRFLLGTLFVVAFYGRVVLPLYYRSRWFLGLMKVLLIKLGYALRHILLMSGFKSFGLFIDIYQLAVRAKDMFMGYMWYRGMYRIYYGLLVPAWDWLRLNIGHYLYYTVYSGTRDLLLYRVGHFLYYRIGYYLYYVVLLALRDFFRYRVRHGVLMLLYKSYGLSYDFLMWGHRFTKQVLLYPFFKIYWFSRFQYEKRIKKLFRIK